MAQRVEPGAFVEDQIAFIDALLARGVLERATREGCAAQLDAIRCRYADPTFYLGVVGEFSSGKSAFINALVEDELLKTDVVVTTAVATEVVAGERLELYLRFRESARWLSTDRDPDEIRRLLGPAALRPGEQPRDVVARLTTDPRAAAQLAAVRVRHPARLLQGDHVALIDTPGLNAPDEGHAETTLSVLAERADACVIVLRSGQALPLTLTRFLQRADVRAHLRHAVFVVTRMAAVPAEQHEQLLEGVRRGLRDTLALESPLVMPCSVGVVLDHLADPDSVPACDLPWVERFAALRRDLAERLRLERTSIVSDRLMGLLDALMLQLREHLHQREREVDAARAALSKAGVPKLAALADKERARVHNHLDSAADRARQRAQWSAAARRQEAVDRCEHLLDASQDRKALQSAADRLEHIVQVALQAYARDVDHASDEVHHAAAAAVASFDRRFEAAYAGLTQLGARPQPKRSRKSSRMSIERELVADALGQVAMSARPQDGRAATGGIAAGVIAAAFIPIIGPFVGLGTWLIGRTSDDQIRAQCMQALREAAEEIFDEAETVARKHLEKSAKNARQHVDRHIDSYLELFEAAIAEVVARHEADRRRLRTLSANTTRELTELERRQQALSERRAAA